MDNPQAAIERIDRNVRTILSKVDTAILAMLTAHCALIDGLAAEGEIKSETAIRVTSHIDRTLVDLAEQAQTSVDSPTLLQIAEVFRAQAADYVSRLKSDGRLQ